MNSDRPEHISVFRENKSGNTEKDRTVKLVCSFCHTVNEYIEAKYGTSLKCIKCGKTLTRHRNENGNAMKCLDCLLGMETPDGIWCLKFKSLVNEAITGKCREFINKNNVRYEESDRYDR